MRIIYTRHFCEQLEERKRNSPVPLTIELIEDTIKNPDLVMQDPKYSKREWRIKKVAGRCFKVIVEDMGKEIVAITLMFDRTLRRKGLCR
ncbi:DUF4258 domain-containing protein [Desulfurobacterium atlanticum]|uniref:DUF4258 domain-containing protein n=1 Tax=Desulfurobacterium atlanticum TaxID=240169 RepID=A0A238YS21_9BACT|nr:DUF4258 domain-containing protein [Desulfurobacterium atlanticum]SNR73762.1 hypothetical protein SAMN06265340_104139 [Desulfurobacterium atlanticum]